MEIVNKTGKDIFFNTHYKQPAGIFSEFEKCFKNFINKTKKYKSYLHNRRSEFEST